MFEPESVQPSLETVFLSLKPSQVFLVCIFKLMGVCCSHKDGDSVLNIIFVFQRPSGCISLLFEKTVTPSKRPCAGRVNGWWGGKETCEHSIVRAAYQGCASLCEISQPFAEMKKLTLQDLRRQQAGPLPCHLLFQVTGWPGTHALQQRGVSAPGFPPGACKP